PLAPLIAWLVLGSIALPACHRKEASESAPVPLLPNVPKAPAANTPQTDLTSVPEIETAFAGMRDKAHWNVDGPQLYGYYFVDSDVKKLDAVTKRLEPEGYRFVEIMDEANSEPMLHLERVERHTPKSLAARNGELMKLAAEMGVVYDGWDAGLAK
ncbi:MAG: ribonuclease E inhibitor RraB, partial [Polyangiales bacterium]